VGVGAADGAGVGVGVGVGEVAVPSVEKDWSAEMMRTPDAVRDRTRK
jgi:hypothetical protein